MLECSHLLCVVFSPDFPDVPSSFTWVGQSQYRLQLQPEEVVCLTLRACFLQPGVYNLNTPRVFARPTEQAAMCENNQQMATPALIIINKAWAACGRTRRHHRDTSPPPPPSSAGTGHLGKWKQLIIFWALWCVVKINRTSFLEKGLNQLMHLTRRHPSSFTHPIATISNSHLALEKESEVICHLL